jgi:hypothetical protein
MPIDKTVHNGNVKQSKTFLKYKYCFLRLELSNRNSDIIKLLRLCNLKKISKNCLNDDRCWVFHVLAQIANFLSA